MMAWILLITAFMGRRDCGIRSHLYLQDTVLFFGTIRENIAYGKDGATQEEIEAAAKMANADEFIAKMAHGYDTMVGERGLTLSGGQRQRIGIARAIVRNSPILILDEPTAALDTESEKLVMEGLERLMKGRTVIIIAHRLSTIRDADKIVVLKGGYVGEEGTHDELRGTGKNIRRTLSYSGRHRTAGKSEFKLTNTFKRNIVMSKSTSFRTIIILPDDTKKPIVDAIDAAKKSIKIKMFVFSDPDLINAVIAAKARGIEVQVMLNPARRSGEEENSETRKLLEGAAIEVKDSNPKFGLTHEKSMVIDEEIAFIKSLNWATKNLTVTRDYAITTNHPE